MQYAIVRQDAEESRGLYEDLTKRLRAAGVLEGLKPSDITVVDPGRAPAKPSKPDVPLYLAIAAAGGFFLGCCGALLVDTLDNKINSIEDVEQLTGKSILGALPFVKDDEGKGESFPLHRLNPPMRNPCVRSDPRCCFGKAVSRPK